ncbi:MAG: HTH domain-containing protein, partial [Chitinophagaceae bacterium]
MKDNDAKRLSRLTAILIQLQSKRLTTSTGLSEKFGVSVRTIYRDIKALEQAGVPVVTEDGKGYSL